MIEKRVGSWKTVFTVSLSVSPQTTCLSLRHGVSTVFPGPRKLKDSIISKIPSLWQYRVMRIFEKGTNCGRRGYS